MAGRYCFDIETNGLLDQLTKIHCIVAVDLDGGHVLSFYGDNLHTGVMLLQDADHLVGHNIIDFDIPAIQKIYPWFEPKGSIRDSLVLSRLVFTDLKDLDFKRLAKNKSYLPNGRLIGSHGLEAWGHRLSYHKGDYAAEMKAKGLDPWAEFSDEMLEYCINDVHLNVHLLHTLARREFSDESIQLEHDVFEICRQQMSFGCAFDRSSAEELYSKLAVRKAKIERELKEVFTPWFTSKGKFVPKRNNASVGYMADTPFTKVELIEFNPGSRDHIADRLKAIRGWKPSEFTDNGKPKVDENTLKQLPWPEAKLLTEYLLIVKRVGQLGDGREAWLKLEREGRIHGRINTNGAVTGRCTHSRPNLAQVPSVRAPFGTECRSLFRATPGWKFVGADASGLELRCLAHYLARWDEGAYGREILEGDIHTANQEAAGLPTRDAAKTFIYALLYGAGDAKIGDIIGKGSVAGRKLRQSFLDNLPAFGKLISSVTYKADKDGFVRGLDGRKLFIRSSHAALNTLLQGAGAVIMKKAMVNFHSLCQQEGLDHGKDYRQVLFVHDEFQCEAKPEHVERVGELMVEGIRKVTQDYGLRCPLDGEYKVGNNWAETH